MVFCVGIGQVNLHLTHPLSLLSSKRRAAQTVQLYMIHVCGIHHQCCFQRFAWQRPATIAWRERATKKRKSDNAKKMEPLQETSQFLGPPPIGPHMVTVSKILIGNACLVVEDIYPTLTSRKDRKTVNIGINFFPC